MCGIYGFALTGIEAKRGNILATELHEYMEIRGRHAWGQIYWAKDRLLVRKQVGAITERVLPPNDPLMLIGHTRFRTTGSDKDIAHAHPFYGDGLAWVHNGQIWSGAATYPVDSMALGEAIAGTRTTYLDGYGLVCWALSEIRRVFFLATWASADLHIVHTDHGVIWASTQTAVEWACKKANVKIKGVYKHKPQWMYRISPTGMVRTGRQMAMLATETQAYHWRDDWDYTPPAVTGTSLAQADWVNAWRKSVRLSK